MLFIALLDWLFLLLACTKCKWHIYCSYCILMVQKHYSTTLLVSVGNWTIRSQKNWCQVIFQKSGLDLMPILTTSNRKAMMQMVCSTNLILFNKAWCEQRMRFPFASLMMNVLMSTICPSGHMQYLLQADQEKIVWISSWNQRADLIPVISPEDYLLNSHMVSLCHFSYFFLAR